jgi:hypothetical protein
MSRGVGSSVAVLTAFVYCLVCFATDRVSNAVGSVFTPFPRSLLFYGPVYTFFSFTLHSPADLGRPLYCTPYSNPIAVNEKAVVHDSQT